jgi:hypothetical protein
MKIRRRFTSPKSGEVRYVADNGSTWMAVGSSESLDKSETIVACAESRKCQVTGVLDEAGINVTVLDGKFMYRTFPFDAFNIKCV